MRRDPKEENFARWGFVVVMVIYTLLSWWQPAFGETLIGVATDSATNNARAVAQSQERTENEQY